MVTHKVKEAQVDTSSQRKEGRGPSFSARTPFKTPGYSSARALSVEEDKALALSAKCKESVDLNKAEGLSFMSDAMEKRLGNKALVSL